MYLEIVRVMKEGMGEFWVIVDGMMDSDGGGSRYRVGGEMGKVYRSMLVRLEFYWVKLNGIENYVYIMLERLGI